MGYWNCLASSRNRSTAPGVRTTLFVPVRALEGFGEGEIRATISGLNLPGETLGAQHKQWQIGVRPARPAQTVNSGIALAPGESWHVPEQHLANVSPATLQGQLLLSGKPPLNLARYIRELKAYPYGCRNKPPAGYSRRCILMPLNCSRSVLPAIAMKNGAPRWISASPAYYRCSVITAVLRYGMKMGRKSPANGLRDGFPHSLGRAGI